MPTIFQLPSADTVSAADLIPVSQDGTAHAVSVGALLAQSQPAIIIAQRSLLGRASIGPGGPDSIAVGEGLILNGSTLSATGMDPATLPVQTTLATSDQVVVTNGQSTFLLALNRIRGLFSAGSNVTIDNGGVISASVSGGGTSYNITRLPSVAALTQNDLVGVSQAGQDHTITYANLLDGLTIDQAQSAGPAADTDTFWVAQNSNVMLRQTLNTLWPWIALKLPLWKRPVIELRSNTSLDGSIHNTALLVCSNPISITALSANMGNGFMCHIINVASGPLTFSGNITTSDGSGVLPPNQSATIYCITYSVGTTVFASVGGGGQVITAPGQVLNLAASYVAATTVGLVWSAPATGGAASSYAISYRTSGTTNWISAGQTGGGLAFTVNGLQGATRYDFSVIAANAGGTGPISAIASVTTALVNTVPGAPTAVSITNIGTTALTCSWTAPATGGAASVYGVQYRISGQSTWSSAVSNIAAITANITGLLPGTTYDFEVTVSNPAGSGPPSAVVSVTTLSAAGLVSSIVWNLAPIGNFTRGTGVIGVNVHVTPANSTVEFGFSTTPAASPSSWTAAVHVNSDLWGAYVPTPATTGSWYAWARGTDGSSPTVYPTPFTVT